ncbi:TonB-dependent receptor plug domain-containing protein [Patiriisocius sp. Uisw_047]|uniref:TonB-dependent receptor plug domain-containing protein n=1 Tax=Patiriisocius sp. Uisw_047 TaxID=3230969 RepID=UPI0039E755AD
MKKVICAIALIATAGMTAQQFSKTQALDSVYLDTKILKPRDQSGKIVTLITATELASQQGDNLATIINAVSGIELNGSRSNDGQNLGYFVRGGRNRQVVILIDGVQVNDPSSIANDFDLRLVSVSSVEQIEIIKGAASVLYGTGAGAGVINITTKKEAANRISGSFMTTVGTNNAADKKDDKFAANEFTNAAKVSGTLNWFTYDVDFNHRYVDGLSAIAAPEGEEAFDSDAYERYNAKLRLGAKINKDIRFSQFFSIDEFDAAFDDFSYTDAPFLSETRQLRTGGNFVWKYAKGEYVFNDSFSWIKRDTESSYPSKFDSKLYSLDNYLTYHFTDNVTALIGLNYNSSSFNSYSIPFGETVFTQNVSDETATFDIIDPYVNATINKGDFTASAGARLNIHSDYGSHIVYNINPSYLFTIGESKLKALASFSTAYITPSLFQLHDPLYGNLELMPEENTTLEGGIEFTGKNSLRVSALYFNRNEKNFVDFVTVDAENYIFQYQNISEEFTASGVEVELGYQATKALSLTANYTNTQVEERFALRIPEHKVNASARYALTDATSFGLNFQMTGERTDSFFNPDTFESETVILDSFSVIDFNVSTQVLKELRLFAAVNNVLDTAYEELFRYQTRGRNIRVGLALDF